MNQAPSNQTGVTGTFNSQPAPQTNPFSADLRGEFTSNFGTNTNAVSQIFKEGGFVSESKKKYIIIGAVAAIVIAVAVAFYVMTGDESSDNEFPADETKATAANDKADDQAAAENEDSASDESAASEDKATTEEEAPAAEQAASTEAAPPTGAVKLVSPADGAKQSYDETKGPTEFTWEGGPGTIVFSRNPNMVPEVRRVTVSSGTYKFHHPHPGRWFWKVENTAGSSAVQKFTISAPERRNIVLSAPAAGAALAGTGGSVAWTGDNKVAFYRVELSNGGWANPQYRFATAGNSVTLQGVSAGSYQLRLGGFSEVAGRWEYSQPISVTVQ